MTHAKPTQTLPGVFLMHPNPIRAIAQDIIRLAARIGFPLR